MRRQHGYLCHSPLSPTFAPRPPLHTLQFRMLTSPPPPSPLQDRAPRPPAELGCKRVVFCSGKVFYDLHAQREANGSDKGQVALVRLEQLAPFPFDLVCRELRRYPGAEVVWCQVRVGGAVPGALVVSALGGFVAWQLCCLGH